MAKEFLSKGDVTFTEVDVSSDTAGRKEMIEKSGQMAVPVILVNGQMIVGFDQGRLEELLKE